jgi:hypothetical protein
MSVDFERNNRKLGMLYRIVYDKHSSQSELARAARELYTIAIALNSRAALSEPLATAVIDLVEDHREKLQRWDTGINHG